MAERRLGKPRTEEERVARHAERFPGEELPERGAGLDSSNKVLKGLSKIDWNAVLEYAKKGPAEREKVLAAFGVRPFTEKYPKDEIERLRETLGITECPPCLINAFILDVLLPPPLRPPLALISCLLSGTCP